mgnify:CR=1 FL=1
MNYSNYCLSEEQWNGETLQNNDRAPVSMEKPLYDINLEILMKYHTFLMLDKRIIYLLANRMVPYCSRHVNSISNLCVGFLTEDEWNSYIKSKIFNAKPTVEGKRRNFKKRNVVGFQMEYVERTTWANDLPLLAFEKNWNKVQWLNYRKYLYRAKCTSFTLVYHSYN